MKISIRKIALLFILLENLYVPLNLGFDFRVNYILYAIFILSYPFVYRTVTVSKSSAIGVGVAMLAVILVSGISGGLIESFRQMILIGFNIVFCFLLINAYEYDVRKLFEDYIDLIYFASVIGLIQLGSQVLGFRFGADFSYLGFDMQHFNMDLKVAQSWFQEPSFLAVAFIPVAFVAICRLFGLTEMISIRRSLVILVVLVLSQAATGLFGLLVALGMIILKRYSVLRSPKMLVASAVVFGLVAYLLYSIPKVQNRFDDTAKLFFSSNVTAHDIESINMSTYAIYSNFKVVQAAFSERPVFGSGLGSYESDYYYYIKSVMPPNKMTDTVALNERDANSLFLRVAAELGLFGLTVIGLFIVVYRTSGIELRWDSRVLVDVWIINSSVFVLIVVRLLRMGHYTTLGFVLFLMLYYLSWKEFALLRRQEKSTLV